MRAEFSCFGSEAPATDGLFFALFPDKAAAAQLAKTAQQLCHPPPARGACVCAGAVSRLAARVWRARRPSAGSRHWCGRCCCGHRGRAVRRDLRSRGELSRPPAPARAVQRGRHPGTDRIPARRSGMQSRSGAWAAQSRNTRRTSRCSMTSGPSRITRSSRCAGPCATSRWCTACAARANTISSDAGPWAVRCRRQADLRSPRRLSWTKLSAA